MFTGLIETTGVIKQIKKSGDYKVISVSANLLGDEIKLGESIACDGACLTVITFDKSSFTVEASTETINTTIVNSYNTGAKINIERALKLGDRLGGHMVSGHIDTVGKIEKIAKVGKSIELIVTFETSYNSLVIDKGSIAINGISLTINSCSSGFLSVNIIPHTSEETTIGNLKTGQPVNLEFDLIGKYIQNMNKSENNSLTLEKLKKSGW